MREAASARQTATPNGSGGPAGKGSGRFNARGRGAKLSASFPKDATGWQRDSAGRVQRDPKMRSMKRKAGDAHLRHIERDGVTREVEKGRRLPGAGGREDRHQFRFIVAPEDAAKIGDLRPQATGGGAGLLRPMVFLGEGRDRAS
jgi:hypothetical protein